MEILSFLKGTDYELSIRRKRTPSSSDNMVTCYLRYIIDPNKLTEFETYARKWLPLVERFGGEHHGYFLPHEGANNVAVALFSFPSLAAYEDYRLRSQSDPDCRAAYVLEQANRSIISYERSFMRPVFNEPNSNEPGNA